ncbi:MAG: MFS transporter, partial [Verrucomicrobiota bacterium]
MNTAVPAQPTAPSSKPDSKISLPWFALLALTGLNLFNYLDRQVLSAVVPRIQTEFHLTDNRVGSLATAFMLGYFVTSPFFGWLGDRMARKWLIAGGVAVWSLGTVFSGLAGGFWSLVAFRVLVGFGEASYATLSPSWIADLYAPARRNNALAFFYIAIPVGAALGQIIGGRVEEA